MGHANFILLILYFNVIYLLYFFRKAFSKNGQNTIVAKSDPNMFLGQYSNGGLSTVDVRQLNDLYCGENKRTYSC